MDDVELRADICWILVAGCSLCEAPPLPQFPDVLPALCRFAGFEMGSWNTSLSAASLVIYGI